MGWTHASFERRRPISASSHARPDPGYDEVVAMDHDQSYFVIHLEEKECNRVFLG